MTNRTITLRTAAWFGDHRVELEVPETWDVTTFAPETPPPLSEDSIRSSLEQPVGFTSWSELFKGKKRPLIIVDDLTRPTPADRVIPFLLERFHNEGISPENVSILMATGSHGRPPKNAIALKAGLGAAWPGKTLIHNCFRDTVTIGRTSFGTPVCVNRKVLESDLVIGIGGIYPNHTCGFGGGSKIALGVLGIRSICALHFRHPSAGWGGSTGESPFRRDLNEVALMIGLQATISLHVDVDRQVIRLQCGDFLRYFDEAVEFSRSTFMAPPPHDADVVISNAYPCDLTLEAVRMKGLLPLRSAGPMASKIAIASCVGGLGLHNVYPAYNVPRYQRLRHLTRRIRTFGWKTTGMSIAARVTAPIIRRFAGLSGQDLREGKASSPLCHPIHLYRPSFGSVPIPDRLPGIEVRTSWQEIVRIVGLEQNDRNRLRVVVYPCAFLQVPGPLPADHTIPAEPSGAIEDSSS